MSFREDSSISRQVREECAVLSWFVLLLAYSWSRSWPGRLLINGRRSLAVGLTLRRGARKRSLLRAESPAVQPQPPSRSFSPSPIDRLACSNPHRRGLRPGPPSRLHLDRFK